MNEGRPQKLRLNKGMIFGLLVLAVFIGVVRRFGEGGEIWNTVRHAGWRYIFLALALQAGTYACYAAVWRAALKRTAARISLRDLLPLALAKLFTDQAAPSAGLGGALFVMESLVGKKVPRPAAVGALLVGLAGYYAAYAPLFLIALGIIATTGDLRAWMIAVAAVFGIVVLALAAFIILFWTGGLFRTVPRKILEWRRLQPFLAELQEVPSQFKKDWMLLFEATLFSSGIFILDAASLWAILFSLHIQIGFGAAFASFMVAAVASTIGIVPGGLGVFEGSETAALVFFGVSIEGAFAATLILRGMTYWLPMIPGLWIVRRELLKKNDDSIQPPGETGPRESAKIGEL